MSAAVTPEDFNLDKIYPVSVDSFSEFRCQNAEDAYETLIESASALFDKFVMIRGGIEAQTEDEIEFYRWLSQLRYSDKTYSVGLIFSNMVKLYLTDIQEILLKKTEPSVQKELDLFS